MPPNVCVYYYINKVNSLFKWNAEKKISIKVIID